MKYLSAFRDEKIALTLASRLSKVVRPDAEYNLMEFCGGHTHAIYRNGLLSFLPKNINMIHGPGCPVCVLPIKRIDYAIALSQLDNVIFCSYGDMLRIPGSHQNSLLKAKAKGADVRMIYSVDNALEIARNHPTKEVIFFAIGFETTTPPTAVALLTAKREQLNNFSIFCNHVLTPMAMEAILNKKSARIDGFIGPSHVSVVIGSEAYHSIATQYKKPIVIAGFEPLDVMQSILMLVEMINNGDTGVKNQYTRAVIKKGNLMAQQFIQETLTRCDQFEWRGLGWIPHSGMKIKKSYEYFDAEKRFPLTVSSSGAHRACECAAVLCGMKKPTDCKLFEIICTPENPLGSCMVSSEGACSAYYTYGRVKKYDRRHC